MYTFLSETALTIHQDYIKKKKLQFSIFESSFPFMKGAKFRDILHMKLSVKDKREALFLSSQIELHDAYFSSFVDERFVRSMLVEKQYGSEAALLNEIYRIAMERDFGFITVSLVGENIEVAFADRLSGPYIPDGLALAIDLYEHAYFMDYGFDKGKYLLSCLPYLDLGRLSHKID